ncbi:hypothetical protein RN001_016000 [Aquatica leii]|uniref:Peptidase M3A/M3B catalytic domain-containing protein n=1 Tax=Aquatica leii TaxID=1421715 RepID=A0AAN7S5Y0_9COLE|nr:hypothetical protein RN001_016000 [Aquatica leii]
MNKIVSRQFHNLLKSLTTHFSTWTPLAATFNSRPDHKLNLKIFKKDVGLFDVPQLDSYDGFFELKNECIFKTDLLTAEVTSNNRTRKIVEVFDELSDTLCKVADLAEFIRLAHPSKTYTDAAESASATISTIVERLNTDRALYSALNDVIQYGDKFPTNEFDDLMARLFLFDFEQSGIHLPENERNKVVTLNNALLQLGQQFVAACGNVRVVDKRNLSRDTENLFTTDGHNVIVSGLCSDTADSQTREMAYKIYLYPDMHQDALLTEILQKRHELAQICGFPTYSHRALKGSTVETPESVMEFLDTLSVGLTDRAAEDFTIMDHMKRRENIASSPLQVWDTAYFTKKAKQEIFDVHSTEYSAYFSLGSCMEGLNTLFTELYGISLVVKEIMPGECWSLDVYKIEVTHETEGLLGYIYCDFYERTGKLCQDCHFTIRGGKLLADGSYQHPIVVLMLNLPLPQWSSPTLLSPSMVDALFHEMGHAMHSMLARTRYQHVTGTRCSTDFAEVPSILMEYFCNDPRVLKTFARHFQTKQPMPDEMIQRLCASKNLFMASEMQMQLFYSALDQIYHGAHPLSGSTTDVLAEVQQKYYGVPYIENTAWQLRFSHLVGYGAKYYSYLVSRSLASCIWQNYFENDPLNRLQGNRLRHELLSFGGSKSPRNLVADFLQKELTNDLLVNSLITEIDSKQYQIDFLKNNKAVLKHEAKANRFKKDSIVKNTGIKKNKYAYCNIKRAYVAMKITKSCLNTILSEKKVCKTETKDLDDYVNSFEDSDSQSTIDSDLIRSDILDGSIISISDDSNCD